MFNDIESVYKIQLNRVKASPSVNSPNDGAFNSEENVRWANKKLTTKPFIYGKTEQDVEHQFGSSVAVGWYGGYCSSASLSMDGYLIRVADSNSLSYDADNNDSSSVVDLMPAQKFISDLVGCATDNQLTTNYSDFLFSAYDPSLNGVTPEIRESWIAACNSDTIMGFICMTYKESYLDALTVDLNTVSYEDTTISIDNTVDTQSPDTIGRTSESDPRTNPVATTQLDSGSVTSVKIYYPIKLKTVKKYNSTTKTYSDDYRLYFTDIFGIEFSFITLSTNTHLYPSTRSLFSDMDVNRPLNQLNFDQCKKTTIPVSKYNYSVMYSDGLRKDFSDPVTISEYITPSFELPMLTRYSLSNLVNYVPASVSDISEIRSTMDYYCIPFGNGDSEDIISNLCLRGQNSRGETYSTPIAFMGSNGMITPDGFATGSNGTISKLYPVEGYMHFIKRIYLIANEIPVTEEAIASVTTKQLTSWTSVSQVPSNGSNSSVSSVFISFNIFYQNYLYPLICSYLNLAYSSLMDNTIYASGSNSSTMKAVGCGRLLQGVPETTDNYVSVDQNYSHSGYVNVGGRLESQVGMTDLIQYHKDYLSDKTRLIEGSLSPSRSIIVGKYQYQNNFDFDFSSTSSVSPNYFEDPINLVRRCMVSNTYSDAATYTSSDNTIFYTDYQQTMVINNINQLIAVDDYLFPKIPSSDALDPSASGVISQISFVAYLATTYVFSPNTNSYSRSFGNGLAFTSNINSWDAAINYIAELQKDSLKYLSGKDYEDGLYGGIKFRSTLKKHDMESEDLLLFRFNVSSIPRVLSYDEESFNDSVNYNDLDVKTAREAFIPVCKIYRGNLELGMILDNIDFSLDDIRTKIAELDDDIHNEDSGIIKRIDDIEDTLNGDTGLVERVSNLYTITDRCRKLIYSGELRTSGSGYHVYYQIFGFDEDDQDKICEIFTNRSNTSIESYSSPFDPQTLEEDKSPLIGKGIGTINVHPGIMDIGSYVFSFDFTHLNLPYTLAYFREYACSGSSDAYSGPRYVTLAPGVRLLNEYCFRYCRVHDIYVPNTVVSGIGMNRVLGGAQSAFVDCGLSRITFDSNDIGTTACENCTNLYDVTVTKNVSHIYPYAFVGCSDYLSINYLGTKSEFMSIIKDTGWNHLNVTGTKFIQNIYCVDLYETYNPDIDDYEWHAYDI